MVSCKRWMRLWTLKAQSACPEAEAQAVDGDADLGRPAQGVAARARLPDSVPARVDHLARPRHERVVAGSSRVHREHVAGEPVAEGIHHQDHVVLVVQVAIALLGVAHDARGVGVLAADAEDEGLRARQHPHHRASAGGSAFVRLDGHERVRLRSALPRGLVQRSVHLNHAHERPRPQRRRGSGGYVRGLAHCLRGRDQGHGDRSQQDYAGRDWRHPRSSLADHSTRRLTSSHCTFWRKASTYLAAAAP